MLFPSVLFNCRAAPVKQRLPVISDHLTPYLVEPDGGLTVAATIYPGTKYAHRFPSRVVTSIADREYFL
jgi:hypothetical protein